MKWRNLQKVSHGSYKKTEVGAEYSQSIIFADLSAAFLASPKIITMPIGTRLLWSGIDDFFLSETAVVNALLGKTLGHFFVSVLFTPFSRFPGWDVCDAIARLSAHSASDRKDVK